MFQRYLKPLTSILMLFIATRIVFGDSATEPTSSPSSKQLDPLPGMISNPLPLPGNRRWQMFMKNIKPIVGSVAWSPDGKWLAVASGRTVRLYDMTGLPQFKRILAGHTDFVRSVRFSPDGTKIATASLDGTARIWSSEGRQELVYHGHQDGVQDISWHPTGMRLATASDDGTVQIWTLEGKRVVIQSNHEAPVNAVAYSPDGKRLASGCENKTIRYWSEDGKPGPILLGHLGAIRSLAWHPDSKRLLSCDHGIESNGSGNDIAHMKIWDIEGNQLASQNILDAVPTQACWSPDGTDALCGGFERMTIWNLETNKVTISDSTATTIPVAWKPTGELIAAGSSIRRPDGTEVFAIQSRTIDSSSVDTNHAGQLAVGLSSQAFALVDSSGKLICESQTGATSHGFKTVCRFSPDGQSLVTGCRKDRIVHRFDATGHPLGQPISFPSFVSRSLNWSQNGRFLVTAGDSAVVEMVEVSSGAISQLGRHIHGITNALITPDQERVCSVSFDGAIRFWSRDGKPERIIQTIAAPIRSLDWAQDGEIFATGHEDHSIRIWKSDATADADIVIGGHGGFVETLNFSPDGLRLASGSRDYSVRLWKRDGSAISVLSSHEGTVGSVRWSHDGTRLFSGSEDGTVRCWNPETGVADWTILFGDRGGYVTLDSQGRLLHGDEKVLDADFVFFAENDQGQLVKQTWHEIQTIMTGLPPGSCHDST